MYEQIDSILTRLDLGSASPAELRRPWVPLHGVQNGPRYLCLGLMYLNLDPPDRSLYPRDVQEASRTDSGAILDTHGRPRRPTNTVKYKVCVSVFHVAPQKSSRTSKSAPGRSRGDLQEAPRSGPGRPRGGSRGFKTAPRAARSAPRAPPEPPRVSFRAALAAK